MINLFIGGKYQKPSSGSYNGDIAIASEKDLQSAIDTAKISKMPDAGKLRKIMLEFAELLEKQKSEFINEIMQISDLKNDFDEALKSVYFFAGSADKWKDMYLKGCDYKYISVKAPVVYNLKGKLSLTGLISSIFRPFSCGAAVVIIVPLKWANIANLLSLVLLNIDVPPGTINIITEFNTNNKNIYEINYTDAAQSIPAFSTETKYIRDIIISKQIEI